ncbi:hypothetical protein EDB85DRAFT_1888140 [Lactarius pseudohatsudake]|nr:hypothetical protein EDB85DRAFT_1888140 [Lactarius pseudohatsudake]
MPVYDSEDMTNTSYNTSFTADAETTLSQRIFENNMLVGTKGRVDEVAKRCLIKNTTGSAGLDYVHCLKSHQLNMLEFAWNMEPFTLNLNTRRNIIHFHLDEVYHYTLIAHQDMQQPIYRQKSPPLGHLAAPMEPPAEDPTYYPYPYHDFPTIKSRVHPSFIICNSGFKLEGRWFQWKKEYETRKLDLAKLCDIWYSWKNPRAAPTGGSASTPDASDGGPDIEDDGGTGTDIEDNSSQRTTPCRVHRSTRLGRKVAGEQESLALYETLHESDQ